MKDQATPFARVAIITRTRDRPLLLKRCIESVLAQTCQDFLHVIVNDAGAPETVETALAPYKERYGDRLLVVHRDRSCGMEAATNAGLKASASTYVVVLDDDDTWHPSFLERALAALAAPDWPGSRGVTCRAQIVYERFEGDTIVEEERVPFNAWVDHMDLFRLFAWNRFTGVGFLYERSVHEEIGYYDEALEVCGDWEFNLRFLTHFEIVMLRETLAYWHQRRAHGGAYGNSVTDGWPTHMLHRIKLANQWVRDGLKGGTLDYAQMFAQANLVEYHEHIVAERRHMEQRVSALQANIDELRASLGRIEGLAAHAANALDDAAAKAEARKLKRRERRTFGYWRDKARALFLPSGQPGGA